MWFCSFFCDFVWFCMIWCNFGSCWHFVRVLFDSVRFLCDFVCFRVILFACVPFCAIFCVSVWFCSFLCPGSSCTRRSPTQCQTPARPHPRVEPRTRWSSSFLSQPFPASVFPVQPTAPTRRQLCGPLAHPLFSHMPTIQYLSTNPRFPPFNLPHIEFYTARFANANTVVVPQ